MEQLQKLINTITRRVNVNLVDHDVTIDDFVRTSADIDKLSGWFASYEADTGTPMNIYVTSSNIAGSYLLGKCRINASVVYKSDVRGDELKRKGDRFLQDGFRLPEDEVIAISDSFLYKTLVHNASHNPETPELFFIKNTVAADYSTINGSTLEGCFLGRFSTIDRTALHSCVVGDFAFIRAGELYHQTLPSGTVMIRDTDFSFDYIMPEPMVSAYIQTDKNHRPSGKLADFMKQAEAETNILPDEMYGNPVSRHQRSIINRFAVLKADTSIGDNTTVCQKVLIDGSSIGNNSVITENAWILSSRLSGYNVISHGSKLIHTRLGVFTYTGMNCFLNGTTDAPITIGEGAIVLPHTIIDSCEPIDIPGNTLVWGVIREPKDLTTHSVSINRLKSMQAQSKLTLGAMSFTGNGDRFIQSFQLEIDRILERQGAFNDQEHKTRVQTFNNTTVHVLQPYRSGPDTGIYPTVTIRHTG